MDCRHFRKQHTYFIDDMLSGVETWAMRDHVSSCAGCARLDAQLRRSLLVARGAATLEVSTDFHRRLRARLAAERLANSPFAQETRRAERRRRVPALAAAAAALLAIGVGGFSVVNREAPTPAVAEPVATAPSVVPAANTAANVTPVTEVVTEPVHPAMLLAQRAAEQLAAAQARAANSRATH